MQVHSASVLTLEGFPKYFWPFVWLLWPPNYPFHWVNLALPHGSKTFLSYPFRISMDCRARWLTKQTWLKLEAHTRLQSMGNKPRSGDQNGASQILAPPWPPRPELLLPLLYHRVFSPTSSILPPQRQGRPQELLLAQQTCATLSKEVHSSPTESLTTSLCPRWGINRNRGKQVFFFSLQKKMSSKNCLLREDRKEKQQTVLRTVGRLPPFLVRCMLLQACGKAALTQYLQLNIPTVAMDEQMPGFCSPGDRTLGIRPS